MADAITRWATMKRCHLCNQQHETIEMTYGGIPWSSCPEVPEGYLIPLRNVPVVIHGPQGEVFKWYRYELAGVKRDA